MIDDRCDADLAKLRIRGAAKISDGTVFQWPWRGDTGIAFRLITASKQIERSRCQPCSVDEHHSSAHREPPSMEDGWLVDSWHVLFVLISWISAGGRFDEASDLFRVRDEGDVACTNLGCPRTHSRSHEP